MSQNHTHAVRIGPEFFAKAKNDYRDWRWAIAREYLQNCIDAPGCTEITVTVEDVANDMAPWTTRLTVENNGAPMSKEILTGKLLSLGGSGKNCVGAVGGFGKAKELLYFSNLDYEITTGNMRVTGSGAGYDLVELPEELDGTRSVVTLADKVAKTIADQFRKFITLSEWAGTFRLKVVQGTAINTDTQEAETPAPTDEVITARLAKGKSRKELTFGTVYTNSDRENLVVVRIAGTPMFTKHTGYKGCVVIELNGQSNKVLQSSRDALKYEFDNELDNFMVELTVNKRSALKDNRPKIEVTKFEGYKLKDKKANQYLPSLLEYKGGALVSSPETPGAAPTIKVGGKEYEADTAQGHVAAALINLVRVTGADGTLPSPRETSYVREIPVRPEFFLKNETGLKIPSIYTPDAFSAYSRGLIWRWMGVLVTLADIYECTTPFAVGFIINEEGTVAQFEKENKERIVYIKPVDVIRHETTTVLKPKWSLTGHVIWDLVSVAAHEFVHYLGYMNHDEDFAGKLTEVLAVCMRERSRIAKVFQSRVEWPDA